MSAAELHRYAARRLTERRVLTGWLDADDVVQSWPKPGDCRGVGGHTVAAVGPPARPPWLPDGGPVRCGTAGNRHGPERGAQAVASNLCLRCRAEWGFLLGGQHAT